MIARRLALCVSLAACGPDSRSAATYADAPQEARAVLAQCGPDDRGGRCAAARAGLAEAERRQRMARYETAF